MRTLSTKQKTISIYFRWCDAKCFKSKWILAFFMFLKQKTFGVAIEWFSDSTIDIHLLGLPPQTTITSRSGGRCRFFMRVFSVWICKRAFRSGIEPHAANHKSSKWDACRLFMRIERRFDQVMFDWITSRLSEQNKNLN